MTDRVVRRAQVMCVVVAVAIVVLADPWGFRTSKEGVAVLAALRAEPVWTDLPEGTTEEWFAADERCLPSGTSVGLSADLGEVEVDQVMLHYFQVLQETGWTIVRRGEIDGLETIIARKVIVEGSVELMVTALGLPVPYRVEVTAWPVDACR